MTLAPAFPLIPKKPTGKVPQALKALTGNGLSLTENVS